MINLSISGMKTANTKPLKKQSNSKVIRLSLDKHQASELSIKFAKAQNLRFRRLAVLNIEASNIFRSVAKQAVNK